VALVFVAPAEFIGVGAGAVTQGAGTQGGDIVQSVNRTHKGDRLNPSATGKSQQNNSPTILVGCDPVISPLTATASANFPGFCVT
jgi:hypothetical protein